MPSTALRFTARAEASSRRAHFAQLPFNGLEDYDLVNIWRRRRQNAYLRNAYLRHVAESEASLDRARREQAEKTTSWAIGILLMFGGAFVFSGACIFGYVSQLSGLVSIQ